MSQSDTQVLTLAVTGSLAAQLGPRSHKSFTASGGSIGRSEECDWVLAATGVSREHAIIRCVNGIYFVEDRSTNGLLLNDAPLIKGDPAALKDGDHLRIDNFDIAVGLVSDSETIVQSVPPAAAPAPPAAQPPASSPFPAASEGDLLDFGLGEPAPAPHASSPSGNLIPGTPATSGDSLDPLSFLDTPPSPPPSSNDPPVSDESWNHSSSTADHFHPPATDTGREADMLPDDWDLGPGDAKASVPAAPPPAEPPPAAPPPVEPPSEPSPAPVQPPPVPAAPPVKPPPTPTPPARTQMPVASVPSSALQALPSASGDDMLRVVVDGVMDVLRARAEIKNAFRLSMTVIQRAENNPLKFALGTDEALKKILADPDPAFLTGSDAFEDAFDDIRCHQMAMLAGVRAGFDAALQHFNPERFERDDAGGRRGFGGKGRYWERYSGHYRQLTEDPDGSFQRLFGDEFARAYEEQLARLKSARRAQRAKS